MSRDTVAVPGGNHAQAIIEAGEDLGRRERPDARRRELDGERETIEPSAEASDGHRVRLGELERRARRPRAVDEQADGLGRRDAPRRRVGCGKRQHGNQPRTLVGHTERLATGGEDAEAGTLVQQPMDEGRTRVDQVLAVVDHEQKLRFAKGVAEGIRVRAAAPVDPEHRRHVSGNDPRLGDRCELDPRDSVGEPRLGGSRHFGRQAGLAAPASAGERHKPLDRKRFPCFVHLSLAADEARDRRGQGGRISSDHR